MFFVNDKAGEASDATGSRLFACGTVIAPEQVDDLYRIVDDAWATDGERFGEARAALDRYTHAPERAADDVAGEMRFLATGPAPTWMYAKLDPPAVPPGVRA
jgi:hypothetical protein